MQLRTIINAILDARVHAHGMTEAEAMALMTDRGHQEEGEAAGKWRRALLTSAQLSTYYVGYTEVSDLAAHAQGRRAGAGRPGAARPHAGARITAGPAAAHPDRARYGAPWRCVGHTRSRAATATAGGLGAAPGMRPVFQKKARSASAQPVEASR